MNKTRHMMYQSLAIAFFIIVAIIRPIGIGSGTLWTGILCLLHPYLGWRTTVSFLVAESLVLALTSYSIPVIGGVFLLIPLQSFVFLFVTFFFGCFTSFIAIYIGADILGVRRYVKKIFP